MTKPIALKRPLVFGDEEQIKALRSMEGELPEYPEGLSYTVKVRNPFRDAPIYPANPVTYLATNIDDTDIHLELSRIKIPACLNKPLEFGNDEQIAALKYIAIKAEAVSGEAQIEQEYEVTIRFSGRLETKITAKSLAEAQRHADSLAESGDLADADIEYAHAEVEPCNND